MQITVLNESDNQGFYIPSYLEITKAVSYRDKNNDRLEVIAFRNDTGNRYSCSVTVEFCSPSTIKGYPDTVNGTLVLRGDVHKENFTVYVYFSRGADSAVVLGRFEDKADAIYRFDAIVKELRKLITPSHFQGNVTKFRKTVKAALNKVIAEFRDK